MASHADDEARDRRSPSSRQAFSWLRRPDLVSIAAVRGHAIGAGFQLALACDLRVLTEDAQFTMAEVALGLVPDLGGTKRLVELVGYARALDICVTGRRVGAAEADADRPGHRRSCPATTSTRPWPTLTGADPGRPPRRRGGDQGPARRRPAAARFAEQEAAEREAQLRRIRDLAGLGE